jgi:predicted ATP-dependent endonuclease of OLD family
VRFSKLIIRNFRSIGPDGLEIRFSSYQNRAVVVGSNGSGKTNILTALGIVLGTYPFSRFSVEETDFHVRNTTEELLIELYFDLPLTDHDVYRKEYKIGGFRYRATQYVKGDEKGALHCEHYCFDDTGKTLVKPLRIFRRQGKPDDGADNVPKPVLVSDQAWKLGNVFYLDVGISDGRTEAKRKFGFAADAT